MKIDDDLYEYAYDDIYNITDIFLNGEKTNHYEYDSLSELIRDDNYLLNRTYRFTYDSEGNILTKREYELNSDNVIIADTFEYSNPNWVDQLTKFNNEAITYDEIGNPITIGSKTLTWTNGRSLKTYNSNESSISYTYNKDGIRTSKTVNGIVTNYYTVGTDIAIERCGTNVLYFIRDDDNNLLGFKYNDTLYYYIKNVQEDIIGLKDAEFNTIAKYTYDAWGKLVSVVDAEGNIISDQNHIALINPFRYRSYYYDSDTGLYYLKSRYYNPSWGRFINADKLVYTAQGPYASNMHAYTGNNPVCRKEYEGLLWFQVAGALIGAGISAGFKAYSNYLNGEDILNGVVGAGFGGAFSGFLATTPFGLTPIGAAVSSYGGALIESAINESDTLLEDVLTNGTTGLIFDGAVGTLFPINSGWIRPTKFKTSFVGNYSLKLHGTSIVSEEMQIFYEEACQFLNECKQELAALRDFIFEFNKVRNSNSKGGIKKNSSGLGNWGKYASGEGFGGGTSFGGGFGGGGGSAHGF